MFLKICPFRKKLELKGRGSTVMFLKIDVHSCRSASVGAVLDGTPDVWHLSATN